MSKIDELVQQYDLLAEKERVEREEKLERALATHQLRAEELLTNDLIGEYSLEVVINDAGGTVFMVWPTAWSGRLHFQLVVFYGGRSEVRQPKGMGTARRGAEVIWIESPADWDKPPLADFLVAWHRHYQDIVRLIVERNTARFGRITLTEEEVQSLYGELVAVAPERKQEWDGLLRGWQERDAERVEMLAEARVKHAAAFERYMADMVAHQAEYQAADERIRATWEDLVSRYSRPTSVRCIEYGVVTYGEDGGQVETRTILTPDVEKSADKDQWTVLENGRSKTWTFRTIIRISAPYLVEPEADKYCGAFLYRYTPFGSLAFLEKDEREVEAVLAAMEWPARPELAEYGLFNLTAEEEARLVDVLGRNK